MVFTFFFSFPLHLPLPSSATQTGRKLPKANCQNSLNQTNHQILLSSQQQQPKNRPET